MESAIYDVLAGVRFVILIPRTFLVHPGIVGLARAHFIPGKKVTLPDRQRFQRTWIGLGTEKNLIFCY